MPPATGQPLDRVDARLKVTGRAAFSAEIAAEKIAYAALVTSTVAKGTIVRINAQVAERSPGVLAVLTHLNAPKMAATKPFDPGTAAPKAGSTSANILQTDRIYWDGQPVAVVVAETFEQARDAAVLVEITYQAEPAHALLEQAKSAAYTPANVLGEKPEIRIGDAESALKSAAFHVDLRYTTPRENHNPIEPHATTVIHRENGRLEIHDASQYVYGVREFIAEKFNLSKDHVRVLSPYVGGGFGSKGLSWPHVALAVAAALHTKRNVKLPLTREQMYRTVGYRTSTEQRVALGANADGTLTALIHTGLTATSTTNDFAEQFTFPARHLYAAPNIHLKQDVARVDTVPPTFMRAPGEAPGTFALESALDELSYAVKLDPIELRLRNDPKVDPTTHHPYSSRHLREAYALGADKFGWSRRNPQPRSMTDGPLLVGLGVATAYYPAYQRPASARVILRSDGTALVQSAAHEMGMGTATVQAQAAADRLRLPVDQVTFQYGDTDLPQAPVAGGSSTTASVGAVVAEAVAALREKLVALARTGDNAPLARVNASDIELRDSGLYAKGERRGESLVALLARHALPQIEAVATAQPPVANKVLSLGSYGAQFCEVRVDPDFGTVRVVRFVGAYDCGTILNAKTARSQFIGGITMGIGMALMEETLVDGRTGRVMTPNLADYHVPVHADIPHIDAYFLDIPDPAMPLGARGIGEIGITGVAAAVANAVYHATGKRVRDLPLTPDKLL